MRAEKAKEFFSEEKNQKTFVSCCRGPSGPHKYLNLQKSFASFLQKRRPCFRLPHAIRFRASPGRRMGRPQGRSVLGTQNVAGYCFSAVPGRGVRDPPTVVTAQVPSVWVPALTKLPRRSLPPSPSPPELPKLM